MPSAVWTPNYAITASGREVDFSVLLYSIWDLCEWGHLAEFEYAKAHFWIMQYKNGGPMPGEERFFCVWSNEMVYFTTMLDGLWELYIAAMNETDITDDEEADERMEELLGIDPADYDLLYPWPVNIGRFGLMPLTNENAPPNVQ